MRRPLILPLLILVLSACMTKADGELSLSGALKQGGMLIGQATPGARVTHNGKAVEVYEDGHFLIGFGRDDVPSQKVAVRWPSGNVEERTLTIATREYAVQRLNVDQSRVTPPASVQARIDRESAQVKAARSGETRIAYFDQGWIWPVSGRVSGVYGSARVYNGTPGNPHWGIDIAAPTGTPVLAPSGGIVRLTQNDNYFAGGLIILDHGYGLTSSFLHLSRIDVRPGQVLAKGQPMGAVGSTGRSTGPHLDWRMNLGPSLRLDPALLPLPPGP